jgi:hypothetical protein
LFKLVWKPRNMVRKVHLNSLECILSHISWCSFLCGFRFSLNLIWETPKHIACLFGCDNSSG